MGHHGVEAGLSFFSKKRMFFVWLRTRCGARGGLTQGGPWGPDAAVGVESHLLVAR